ncbi:MAG TPA: threonine ammonia-lyase, biosynthetic [Acidimicrobiia bacterium]|nr:threonine ammonia-lyase, biosynthetic [Acidimicrobiia bacterium]
MSQSSKKISPVYDVAIVSPLEKAEKISKVVGCDTYLKREDLQNVHSFKIRGAYNKIASLSEKQLQAGVITASAGNHAQGVALSAKKLKLKAIVVMPLTTPQIKIDAVKAYGAKVVLHGDSFSDCYEHSVSIARETGMTFVHPFDDEKVIEGQGTIAFEILEQLEGVTHVFIPVGGGGLLAGISQVLKEAKKSITVIGVEPQDANAMQASLKAEKIITLEHVGIFADGVAVKTVGKKTFAIVSEYVDRVITVDNDEICAAIKLIFEDTRNICEPAGALAVAGAKNYFDKHPTKLEDSKVVCINSGSNITFERLQFVAERTLIGAKSESLFAITLPEKPGALKALYKKVIHGYSITEFSYRLTSRDRADIFIGLLTGDKEKKDVVLKRLEENDFEYIDLSHDEYAKEHVRFMIGGKSNETQNERIYAFNFPERPGALKELLEAIHNKFNISLFHYRGQGGDVGSVLIGFEAQDADELEEALLETGYFHKLVKSKSISTFL